MKKTLLIIGALLLASLPVSAQYYGQYASDINVSSFAYGVTPNGGPALIVGAGGGTSGSYSITLDYGKTSTGVGAYPLYPFSGTTYPPFAIGSGATYEVVTPSSASCTTGQANSYQQCVLTATFTYAHGAGDVVRASDGGVFEATQYFTSMGVQRQVVTLTNAQILALYATPVQLLPAPGAGLFYHVLKATLVDENTGTAYASGGVLTVGYGTTAATNALASTVAAAFLTSGTTMQEINESGVLNTVLTAANVLNQPIYITNATGAFTTGTGTLKVILEYSVSVQ